MRDLYPLATFCVPYKGGREGRKYSNIATGLLLLQRKIIMDECFSQNLECFQFFNMFWIFHGKTASFPNCNYLKMASIPLTCDCNYHQKGKVPLLFSLAVAYVVCWTCAWEHSCLKYLKTRDSKLSGIGRFCRWSQGIVVKTLVRMFPHYWLCVWENTVCNTGKTDFIKN